MDRVGEAGQQMAEWMDERMDSVAGREFFFFSFPTFPTFPTCMFVYVCGLSFPLLFFLFISSPFFSFLLFSCILFRFHFSFIWFDLRLFICFAVLSGSSCYYPRVLYVGFEIRNLFKVTLLKGKQGYMRFEQ